MLSTTKRRDEFNKRAEDVAVGIESILKAVADNCVAIGGLIDFHQAVHQSKQHPKAGNYKRVERSN
jgi:hypothetical protein